MNFAKCLFSTIIRYLVVRNKNYYGLKLFLTKFKGMATKIAEPNDTEYENFTDSLDLIFDFLVLIPRSI